MRVSDWNVELLTDVAAMPRLNPEIELYGRTYLETLSPLCCLGPNFLWERLVSPDSVLDKQR